MLINFIYIVLVKISGLSKSAIVNSMIDSIFQGVNYGYRCLYVWIFPELTIITISSKSENNTKFITIQGVADLAPLTPLKYCLKLAKKFFLLIEIWLHFCRKL
jgi:hypothetical protein